MTGTGVAPLDERLGGLRPGGTYLLAGAPGAGKLALLLQFLAEGIRSGERVGLVAGTTPTDVFELGRYFGLDLEEAWRSDRLALVGFRGEYPRRIVHAADPAEAFAELGSALGPVSRLGADPGTLLWESRAGTEMATRFLEWCDETGATVVATVVGGLSDDIPPSTEWVLSRATGALQLRALPSGLREISVLRSTPPVETGPVTLEFVRGVGIAAPSGRLERRRTDPPAGGQRRLLLLALAPPSPDLAGWLEAEYEVTRVDEPLRAVARLQTEPPYGSVLLHLNRGDSDEAIEVCRTLRPMTRGTLLLVSDEEVRASDRARALEAGADDFLSGGVDVRELESRLRRTREAGRPADRPVAAAAPLVEGILVDREFAEEIQRRLATPEHRFFTLVWLRGVGAQDGIVPVLQRHLRSEEGDLAGRLGAEYAVVLQDSRAHAAEAFLHRVASSLRETLGSDARLETEVLTSPADAGRIRDRLPG